jgi:hypothetical protein
MTCGRRKGEKRKRREQADVNTERMRKQQAQA